MKPRDGNCKFFGIPLMGILLHPNQQCSIENEPAGRLHFASNSMESADNYPGDIDFPFSRIYDNLGMDDTSEKKCRNQAQWGIRFPPAAEVVAGEKKVPPNGLAESVKNRGQSGSSPPYPSCPPSSSSYPSLPLPSSHTPCNAHHTHFTHHAHIYSHLPYPLSVAYSISPLHPFFQYPFPAHFSRA